MKTNESNNKKSLYLWLKRGVSAVAVVVWFALMITIFRSGGPFSEQAPQCIFTTMIVFGILTAVYKGIEQLERKGG